MMAVTPSSKVRIRSGGMQRAIHCGLKSRENMQLKQDVFLMNIYEQKKKSKEKLHIWNILGKNELQVSHYI